MARMSKCGLMFDYLNYTIVVAIAITLKWLRSRWDRVNYYNVDVLKEEIEMIKFSCCISKHIVLLNVHDYMT